MRLFLAVPLPPELAGRLDPAVRTLASHDGWRPVPVHQRHVTFGFLGERPAADALAILRTAQGVAAAHAVFWLEFAGVGAFPGARRPNVAFAEGRGGADAFRLLAEALAEALAIESGVAVHPHVTLARRRPRTDVASAAEAFARLAGEHSGTRWGRLAVRELTLFESALGAAGPRYRAMGHALLGVAPEAGLRIP